MRQRMEELLRGEFEYEQPKLLFSEDEITVSIKAGETMQNEIMLYSEDGREIRGYVTSSSRRIVLGFSRFSGEEIHLTYGVDATGLKSGEQLEGWLDFTTNIGEYKIPVVIRTDSKLVRGEEGKLLSLDEFVEIAQRDFREAYRIFTSEDFTRVIGDEDARSSALCKGFLRQPVTYQHLEEFLISMKKKSKVTFHLAQTEAEFYQLSESRRESFSLHRSGWGHLRLEIEARGGFIEPLRKVVTDEDFIGSRYDVEFLIHADQVITGRSYGEIIIRSPYQEEVFKVQASQGPKVENGLIGMEKHIRLSLLTDALKYFCRKKPFSEWSEKTRQSLEQLKALGCYFPEYQMLEAWLLHQEGKDEEAQGILKAFLDKSYNKEELTLAGTFLYISYKTGIVTDRQQVLSRIQSLYMQQGDSFLLLYYLLELDPELSGSGSRSLTRMEELYERGCQSPFLYHLAWKTVCDDVNALRHLSGFWTQVFYFAAKKDMLVSELCMRFAYLTGYEKEFRPLVYQVLKKSYQKYPSDDTLEALCKYIIRGNPRKREYFQWFSLAVTRGLRLTRLYEYYIETMDTSRHAPLPRSLLMYFKYNSDFLGDSRKAYIYASVILNKDQDRGTYDLYEEHMRGFAVRMLSMGRVSEDYAVLYREFLEGQAGESTAGGIARILMTCRLFTDDVRVRQVIVRHDQLEQEEIYPVIKGVAYPRVYTSDAVVLFQDEKQRRYESTVDYSLTRLMELPDLSKKVLSYGCEETGILLHYVENHDLQEDNLSIFEAASKAEAFSTDYKRKIKRRILYYFAGEKTGEGLEGFLKRIDFSEYAHVDKECLLRVLIANGLYKRALRIIEKYGCEGLDWDKVLLLVSAMISRCHFEEDRELVALSSEAMRAGCSNTVTLGYLASYRFGPIDEMQSILEEMKARGMDTLYIEEKILGLLMLTGTLSEETEYVLQSYTRNGGKEKVIGACLSLLSYESFVKEKEMSTFCLHTLLKARKESWQMDRVCSLALLKELSRGQSGIPEAVEIENEILEECVKEGLLFSFFRRLTSAQLSPWQLDDKLFVEIHEDPKAKVTLCYRMDTGLGELTSYRSEPLSNLYQGIFNRCFTLFYGESIHYYFQVEKNGKTNRTSERTFYMSRVETSSHSRYQRINQMLSLRRQGRREELAGKIREYQLEEQYVKEVFKIR